MTKRDEIIKLAFDTFYEHGFHATGVDKLLLQSGISKRTLYKYFPTKEDLIKEAIIFYGQNFFGEMIKNIEAKYKNPTDKILAIFDMKHKKLKSGDYSGCFAINARLEFDGKNKKIESQCSQAGSQVQDFIFKLCKEGKYKNPKKLAQQIVILLQGATVYAQACRDDKAASVAKEVAKLLLVNAK